MSARAETATPAPAGTLGEALDSAARRLDAAGVEAPRREAQLLLAAAAGIDLARVLACPERPLGVAEADRFAGYLEARAGRMPLSRIVGVRAFWSLEFRVAPAVLDPRPDSETLVQALLARVPDRTAALDVLDLGTGSGCLLLALLSELPNARGLGLERDGDAAAVARDNARRLALADRTTVQVGDWADLAGRFDLIVCNPPYVRTAEIAELTPEVADHDPLQALDGGPDGLDAYRALAPRLAGWLAPGGVAALEVGQGQAGAVGRLLRGSGLRSPTPVCDLAGIPRCVLALPETA